MSKLIAWKTPFASASWPSVWISVERELNKSAVFVKTEQLWQLRFKYVAALKVCDESYDDNTRFHIERDEENLCSYLWENSPWLTEFNTKNAEAVEIGTLRHHVLLGGDYNIEVLAVGEIEITRVNNQDLG